ncbi:MAG: hypothetical protein AAB462_00795 [Patescibacteria group bacterium]
MRKNCVLVVGGLFSVCGQLGRVCTAMAGALGAGVDSLVGLYVLLAGLFRGVSHILKSFFVSVAGQVLQGFHTTYNNERRFYLNNLVINT